MEAKAAKSISIFIAEDFEVTRIGLKLALTQLPEFTVVGEAQDGKDAVEQIAHLHPDVVLMDIGLPRLNGIEATSKVKAACPNTKVVILTSHEEDKDIFAALAAGADGYCLKEVDSDQLINAIKAVAAGAAWLHGRIAPTVFKSSVNQAKDSDGRNSEQGAKQRSGSYQPLSPRELEVLELVIDGKSNQEIAEALIVSIETVKTHMRHIMEKLAVSDRTQAAVKAMREGLI